MHRHIVAAAATAAALNRVRGRGICTASSHHHYHHHVSIVPIFIHPPTKQGFPVTLSQARVEYRSIMDNTWTSTGIVF